MAQQTFHVSGMTCDHCVNAVTAEIEALAGVTSVDIDLQAGAVSSVTVVSELPLAEADVRAAVDEAGYELVD